MFYYLGYLCNFLPLYTRNWECWSVVNSLVPSTWLKYAELTGLSCSKVCKHLSLRGTSVSVPSVKFRTSQILTELSVEVVANSHGSRGLYWMLVTLLLWSLSRHIFSPLDERRVTYPEFSPKGMATNMKYVVKNAIFQGVRGELFAKNTVSTMDSPHSPKLETDL